MKNIFILLIVLLLGCVPPKYYWSPTRDYVTHNIDSVCQVDSLPTDVKDWLPHSLRDYESGKAIIQYMYIKDSIIYIRTDSTLIKRL